MPRKKKGGEAVKQAPLPEKIELISSTTGNVREFETEHAIRILQIQRKSGLGSFEIFNTKLYTYDEGSRRIKHFAQPEQLESGGGDTVTERAGSEQD